MEVDFPHAEIKKLLLGINLAVIKSEPVMVIDRWKVYDAGTVPHITYDHRTKNYQVNGNAKEKIVVRFFITPKQSIIKIKYYYLKGTDEVLAFYIVLELVQRVSRKYPLDSNYVIKKLRYL
jgi:hypothetical protein